MGISLFTSDNAAAFPID